MKAASAATFWGYGWGTWLGRTFCWRKDSECQQILVMWKSLLRAELRFKALLLSHFPSTYWWRIKKEVWWISTKASQTTFSDALFTAQMTHLFELLRRAKWVTMGSSFQKHLKNVHCHSFLWNSEKILNVFVIFIY